MKRLKCVYVSFLTLSIIGTLCAYFHSFEKELNMKLVHLQSGFVVAEFAGEKTTIQ